MSHNGLLQLGMFMLVAVALAVPTGYSYGALLLLIGGGVALYRNGLPAMPGIVWAIVGVMVVYTVFWCVDAAIRGEGLREFDRPIRFSLAAIVLLGVASSRLSITWLWAGVGIGGCLAGSIAAWQKLFEGVSRASGVTQTIQFGNLGMLTGLLCICGLFWAHKQPNARRWRALLVSGALAGIAASLFSGSRGGWLALGPFAVIIIPAALWLGVPRRAVVIAILVVSVLATTFYLTPQSGVKARIDNAITDAQQYFLEDKVSSSVSIRLETWRGAFLLFLEKPLVGHGENLYIKRLRELGKSNVIADRSSVFTHAHNEWANVLAKKGLLGGGILLLLYLLPLAWFFSRLKSREPEQFALAIAGVTLVVSFLSFGFTQVSFNHNSGAMMYAFLLATLCGLTINGGSLRIDQR